MKDKFLNPEYFHENMKDLPNHWATFFAGFIAITAGWFRAAHPMLAELETAPDDIVEMGPEKFADMTVDAMLDIAAKAAAAEHNLRVAGVLGEDEHIGLKTDFESINDESPLKTDLPFAPGAGDGH
jgi:hypothetical protein